MKNKGFSLIELIIVIAVSLIVISFTANQSISYFTEQAAHKTAIQLKRISHSCLLYYTKHGDKWPSSINELNNYITVATKNIFGGNYSIKIPSHQKYILIETQIQKRAWPYIRQDLPLASFDESTEKLSLIVFKPKVNIDTIRNQKLVRTNTLPSGEPTPPELRTINGTIYLDGAKIIGENENFYVDVSKGATSRLYNLYAEHVKADKVIIVKKLKVKKDLNAFQTNIQVNGDLDVLEKAYINNAKTNHTTNFGKIGSTTDLTCGGVKVYDFDVLFSGDMTMGGYRLIDIYKKAETIK